MGHLNGILGKKSQMPGGGGGGWGMLKLRFDRYIIFGILGIPIVSRELQSEL